MKFPILIITITFLSFHSVYGQATHSENENLAPLTYSEDEDLTNWHVGKEFQNLGKYKDSFYRLYSYFYCEEYGDKNAKWFPEQKEFINKAVFVKKRLNPDVDLWKESAIYSWFLGYVSQCQKGGVFEITIGNGKKGRIDAWKELVGIIPDIPVEYNRESQKFVRFSEKIDPPTETIDRMKKKMEDMKKKNPEKFAIFQRLTEDFRNSY